MKMKENVIQQMDAVELKEVNGGFPWAAAVTLVSVMIYIYNEGGDFIEGFKETYNQK